MQRGATRPAQEKRLQSIVDAPSPDEEHKSCLSLSLYIYIHVYTHVYLYLYIYIYIYIYGEGVFELIVCFTIQANYIKADKKWATQDREA